mmetsp:Transcript_93289/g.216859  ORF Transcript_93289/g.216859 Transcript_93289/m.216859 type:complete len:443 (-) Transcript_93289:74-1402(-)
MLALGADAVAANVMSISELPAVGHLPAPTGDVAGMPGPPVASASPATDAVTAGLVRVHNAGVHLDAMAMQALGSLPPEHAAEMLEYVADNHGYLRNPSKYISSTVSRGFVPRRSGAFPSVATCATGTTDGLIMPGAGAPGCAAAPSEGLERLLVRAQDLGLVLSNDAVQSLAGLPAEHASELLEFVLEKHGELRDPSNYIASTVARGFKSRRGSLPTLPVTSTASTSEAVAKGLLRVQEAGVDIDDMAKQALASLPPEHALEMLEYVAENHGYLRNPSNYISSTVARGFVPRRSGGLSAVPGGKGSGAVVSGAAGGGGAVNPGMVPVDVTSLERRVLQVNSQSLPAGQQIDFATYLALRCVPQWQATELLDSLEAKSTIISSPCNYLQAAVSKIQRGQGWGGGHLVGSEENGRAVAMQYPPGVTSSAGTAAEQQSFKRQRMW